MKTLSITVLTLILTASPAGAAMVTVQEGDSAGQCGVNAARLVVELSDGSIVSPEESRPCGDLGSATGDAVVADADGNTTVALPASEEPGLEIATLFRSTNEEN